MATQDSDRSSATSVLTVGTSVPDAVLSSAAAAVSDGRPGTASPAARPPVISVRPNRAPIATTDRGFKIDGGQVLTIPVADLLANDRDPDGDRLTVTGVRLMSQAPPGAVGGPTVQLTDGIVSFDPGEQIPWPLIKGNHFDQSFVYELSDGRGGVAEGTVLVTVGRPGDVPDPSGNRAPIVKADTGFRIESGKLLEIPVNQLLANDRDPDRDRLTVTSVRLAQEPGPGQVGGPTVRLDGDRVVYDPGSQIPWPLVGKNGFADSILYEVSDGRGRTATGTATITVTQPREKPKRPGGTEAPRGLRLAGSKRDDVLIGTAMADRIEGRGGKDELRGEDGNDELIGGSDGSLLIGGGGFDTVYYRGSVFDYTIERIAGGLRVRSKAAGSGVDEVREVEQLAFDDRTIYLDGSNNAVVSRPDTGFSVKYGQTLRIPIQKLLENDWDFDGDKLSITKVKRARIVGSDIVYASPHGIQWSSVQGDSIQHTFFYEVTDGRGSTETQTVTVAILPPDDPSDPNMVFMPNVMGMAGNTTIDSSAAYTLWTDGTTPAIAAHNDPDAVELGVKFRASSDGVVTGIRFYKGATNTGTHVGNLWTATGTNLGTVTFTDETASGWQTAYFDNPITISADTTYVASYFAPNGNYAADIGYFSSSDHSSGPLTAPASGTAGGNGVYAYSGSSTFPAFTYNGTNYWVDVVFEPPDPGNASPIPGDDSGFSLPEDTVLTIPVATLLENDTDPDGDPLSIVDVADGTGGSVALNTAGDSVVFTAAPDFNGAAAFTYTVSDGNGGFATGQVSLTVTPVQDAPVAVDDTGFSTPLGTVLRIPVAQLLANDSDADDDPIELTGVTSGSGGTAVLDTTAGEVVFTPGAGFTGTATFDYTIADGQGGTDSATVEVTVGFPSVSLWSDGTTPSTVTINDPDAVELGVKFRASSDGLVTGIRFYKGPQNTGTHVGNLWTATGTNLGTVTFSGETSSGWQTALFPNPIAITANTTYIASYFAPNGRYSADSGYFSGSDHSSGPLTAPASGTVGGNGVYAYSGSSTFPGFTYNGTNYWVDVIFQPPDPNNGAPTAVPDSGTTEKNTPTVLDVLANDSDPDQDELRVSSLDLTNTRGAVVINPDDTISYDPTGAFPTLAAGESSTDSFAYTITDDRGGVSSATVTMTVTGSGDPVNAIVVENMRPGNPQSEWGISGTGSSNIEGFATEMSVNQGETVRFKVNTDATDYRLDIYRLGYYQGLGARKVATVEPSLILPNGQSAPIVDPTTGLVDAGNWLETASWDVPTDAVSGVYIAKLVREDGVAGNNHIYFVVRDDDGASDLVFQTADTTWQAYNNWGIELGGGSFYTGNPDGRAYKVSYNRPFGDTGHSVNRPVFDSEYPMIRWLEANGYDVSYISGIDTDRFGSELLEHKAYLSVGHDEYWSGQQRANVEAARDAGVNLAFFSGNEIYWKTRWEPSIDGSDTPYRTLVTYKETWANEKIDPDPAWTGTWRDPRFSPPSDGGRPENELTGTIFTVDSYRLDAIEVPAEYSDLRFWRDTEIAELAPGQTATLTANVLGYEWDEDLDNGFRPPGLINLSSTTIDVAQYVSDYGNTVGPGTATHNLTLYRAPSGAIVFGAGTTRWSWGLDANHINEASTPDPRMQQATVNLFADMGVQPDTLQGGLTPATPSTDTTAPVSTILTPSTGTTAQIGDIITITGTATDNGGVVGAVEVSTDGGTTWLRAEGRDSWSYTWQPGAVGDWTVLSRAVDDSLNLETPSSGIAVTVERQPGPYSLWSAAVTPANPSENDGNSVELGVKFQAEIDGWVTGIKFYKGAGNTGTHIGNLWTDTGTNLGTVTFTGETTSGWQTAFFDDPIEIEADTTYVASYFAPNGNYASDSDFFLTQGVNSSPLRALSSPEGGGNGVYAYGSSSRFPTDSWRGANYWVDVVFTDSLVA